MPAAVLAYLAFRGRLPIRLAVATGLVARALLLLPEIGFSDDVYRYLWEGQVVAAGENPYLLPPDSAELAHLRDGQVWPRVTHRDVPAAYPPLAQALFAAAAAADLGPRGFRAGLLAFDLLTWFLLDRLLRRRGLDPASAAVWGLSPLVLFEVAGSGHVDAAAVPLAVGGLLAAARARPHLAAASLALAALAKPLALVLLPFVVIRRAAARQLGAFALIVAAGYAPFCRDGLPFAGLSRYATEWTHNSALYPAAHGAAEWVKDELSRHLEDEGYGEEDRQRVYRLDPGVLARAALSLAFAALWLGIALSRAGAERKALCALAAFLLLSPTVHPWYLLWLVPWLAAAPSAPLWLWTAAAFATYPMLARYDALGAWREDRLLRAAEYVPVLAWCAVAAAQAVCRATCGRGGSSEAMPTQR